MRPIRWSACRSSAGVGKQSLSNPDAWLKVEECLRGCRWPAAFVNHDLRKLMIEPETRFNKAALLAGRATLDDSSIRKRRFNEQTVKFRRNAKSAGSWRSREFRCQKKPPSTESNRRLGGIEETPAAKTIHRTRSGASGASVSLPQRRVVRSMFPQAEL